MVGMFRSPLIFDDGSRVEKATDRPRRLSEFLQYWHGAMGAWPPLLEKPALTLLGEERGEGFVRRRVSLEVAPGQRQEGWLLLPDGAGPFPAVLLVYYDPETSAGLAPPEKSAHRDYGLQRVKRGFVTLCIGTSGRNAWKPELGAAACQPLSFHAYVAANVWTAMAALPEVDAKRIGIVGHSYGGKWALFGGTLWNKFAAVAVSDPGIVWDEDRPKRSHSGRFSEWSFVRLFQMLSQVCIEVTGSLLAENLKRIGTPQHRRDSPWKIPRLWRNRMQLRRSAPGSEHGGLRYVEGSQNIGSSPIRSHPRACASHRAQSPRPRAQNDWPAACYPASRLRERTRRREKLRSGVASPVAAISILPTQLEIASPAAINSTACAFNSAAHWLRSLVLLAGMGGLLHGSKDHTEACR